MSRGEEKVREGSYCFLWWKLEQPQPANTKSRFLSVSDYCSVITYNHDVVCVTLP